MPVNGAHAISDDAKGAAPAILARSCRFDERRLNGLLALIQEVARKLDACRRRHGAWICSCGALSCALPSPRLLHASTLLKVAATSVDPEVSMTPIEIPATKHSPQKSLRLWRLSV
jgi:hypothetical protein